VVDYSQFDVDLAAKKLPKYVFITPNLQNDMHDGSIEQSDAWLSREVPKILGSDAFNNGGVLFILWDEGGGLPSTDDPPFIAISPNAKPGYVSKLPYDTSSYLKTVELILGLDPLPCASKAADTVSSMDDLFTVPMAQPSSAEANTSSTSNTSNASNTPNTPNATNTSNTPNASNTSNTSGTPNASNTSSAPASH
jgi:acid phosphatase